MGRMGIACMGWSRRRRWLKRDRFLQVAHLIGVATTPLSPLLGQGFYQKVVKFFFAKKDESLKMALYRLARL